MTVRLASFAVFAICLLGANTARAATLAVMPVRGVNLSEGQCDAIGVLFATAFARDAGVAVLSPAETKAAWQELQDSRAAATRLGATGYVELRAIKLASRVTLDGIVYDGAGTRTFQADVAAPSLDDMDAASARLARALALHQAVAPAPLPAADAGEAGAVSPAVAEAAPRPTFEGSESRNMFGFKTGFAFPVASGRSFTPQIGFGFDARIGPRGHFLEIGAGFYVPAQDGTAQELSAFNYFIDIGGSIYLNNHSVGLYLGAGITPEIWQTRAYNDPFGVYGSHRYVGGAALPLYGQLGINFTRDIRTRIYTELRVSQHTLGIDDPYGGTCHPTVVAWQMGLGW